MKRLVFSVLAAAVLAGCRPAPSIETPAPQAPVAESAPKPRAPEVELLEPGAEPRRVLRDLPPVAGRESRELVLDLRGTQSSQGVTGQILAPPITLAVELERGSGTPLPWTASTGPFGLAEDGLADPGTVIAMQAALDGTQGLELEGTVDRSQALTVTASRHPDAENRQHSQLTAAFRQALELARVRFPDEPVGVGARWRWSDEERLTVGATLKRELVATLEELGEDGSCRLRVETSSSGERQPLGAAMLPEGWSAELTIASGSGTATLAFSPDELLPVELETDGRWEAQLLMSGPSGTTEQALTQHLSAHLR